MAVFKNVSVAFGFASGARSGESLCGTTTPCKDMTSPLAFILSTGIKVEELVHSLPVGMTTKQALASRNKRATGTNGATLSAVFICHQLKTRHPPTPRRPVWFDLMPYSNLPPERHFQICSPFYLFVIWCFPSSRPQHPPSLPPAHTEFCSRT